MKPEVLILDEPTAGLDPKGRDDILGQIAKLHEEAGMTIILVTHSMEDVACFADRLFVMNNGELVYQSPTKEVFAHYRELEQMHLAAPQVTYVMNMIKEKGWRVNTDATTVAEARDEILKALGRLK